MKPPSDCLGSQAAVPWSRQHLAGRTTGGKTLSENPGARLSDTRRLHSGLFKLANVSQKSIFICFLWSQRVFFGWDKDSLLAEPTVVDWKFLWVFSAFCRCLLKYLFVDDCWGAVYWQTRVACSNNNNSQLELLKLRLRNRSLIYLFEYLLLWFSTVGGLTGRLISSKLLK